MSGCAQKSLSALYLHGNLAIPSPLCRRIDFSRSLSSGPRYSPDGGGDQNVCAFGEGCDGRLGHHDPGQHGAAKAEEHGAEPAGEGAPSGHLKST